MNKFTHLRGFVEYLFEGVETVRKGTRIIGAL
jgi:hypothetical protein